MTRPIRIIATLDLGLVLGVWTYLDLRSSLYSQGLYDALHSTAADIALIGLPIVVGLIVRRAWVLGALLGPLIARGYMEVAGISVDGHDGAAPLFSAPAIFSFVLIGLLLMLGVLIGRLAENRRLDGAKQSL